MVGFTVNRDVEFCWGQMEFGGRGGSTRRKAFKGLQRQVSFLARLKEVSCDRGEQRERQLIFHRGGRGGQIVSEGLEFRLQAIGGPRLDRLVVPDRAGHDVTIERPWRPSIESEEVVLGFRGNDFIPFACQDIERGLGAHDLAGWSDQRGIAQFLSDARHFIQHFFDPIERILFSQLSGEIREHATGNLGGEDLGIDPRELAFELPVLSSNGAEVFGDREERRKVQSRVVWGVAQRGHQCLRRRMRSTAGQRRDGRIQHVQPPEDCHEGGH